MAKAKRILVIDEHPVVRRGVAELISQQEGLVLCGEAADFATALDEVARHRPDLVILELGVDVGAGLGLIRRIRSSCPGVAVLVLTLRDESFHAERALRAGARGFLSKQDAGDHFVPAIRHVLNGQFYVSERVSPRLLERLLDVKPRDGSTDH